MITNTEMMKSIEKRYKLISGLKDRSEYKIFFCGIKKAPILAIGMNPGGNPKNINPEGDIEIGNDGRPFQAAASQSFYENNEHDILDCHWRIIPGILKFVLPLCNDRESMRHNFVYFNFGFRRSPEKMSEKALAHEMNQCRPFVQELISFIEPQLIVCFSKFRENLRNIYPWDNLAHVSDRGCDAGHLILRHDVGRVGDHEADIIWTAHPSQFSWVYEKHSVPAAVAAILAKRRSLSKYRV